MSRLGRTVAAMILVASVLGAAAASASTQVPGHTQVEHAAERPVRPDPSTDGGGVGTPPGTDSPQVVGGEQIEIDEAPHQVAIYVDLYSNGNVYPYCGGSIISRRVVMTAAHCLFNAADDDRPFTSADVYVLAGTNDLDDLSVDLVEVDGISVHPRYDDAALVNDLAYLRLAQPLALDSTSQDTIATAVPGDEALYAPATAAFVSGWGATDVEGEVYPRFLRGATVPIVSDAACDSAYRDLAGFDVIDDDTQVCAGVGGIDSCYGDSGGPLTVPDGDDPLLVGVVSWGFECAHPVYRGVYTEVAAYADMTEAHLGAPPFTDVSFGHPFLTEVFHLEADGILGGYPDGSYRSGAVVTRQAMSAFMYRLAGEPPFSPPGNPTFSDVGTGHPFFSEIEWMADAGVSTGFPTGEYRPAAPVTRQAMSAFMYRLADEPIFSPPASPTFSDVRNAHPFFKEVEWMADEGITNGYPGGTYRPDSAVTRQSMAAFMYRLQPLLLEG